MHGKCHHLHGKMCVDTVCVLKQDARNAVLGVLSVWNELFIRVVMLCSQVGLGVAAAVACCIKESLQDTGTSDMACLPSTKDVLANIKDLKQAEQCIAKIQYNPFSPRYT